MNRNWEWGRMGVKVSNPIIQQRAELMELWGLQRDGPQYSVEKRERP